MKVIRFLEMTSDSVDLFIKQLESKSEIAGKHQSKIISFTNDIEYNQLLKIFSANTEKRLLSFYGVNVGHYLNILLEDVWVNSCLENKESAAQSQIEPQAVCDIPEEKELSNLEAMASDAPTSGTLEQESRVEDSSTSEANKEASLPQSDFLFLPVEPCIMVHNSQCSAELMLKYLKLIQTELQKRKQSLLFGWRLEQKGTEWYVVNYGTAADWDRFLNCIKGPNSAPIDNWVDFEGIPDQKDLLACRIRVNEFCQIRQFHGLSVQGLNENFETDYKNELAELFIEEQKKDPVSEEQTKDLATVEHESNLAKIKTTFRALMERTETDKLSQSIASFITRGLPEQTNGSLAFFKHLDAINKRYRSTKALKESEKSELLQIQASSAPAPAESETEAVALATEITRKEYSSEYAELDADFTRECTALLATVETLPSLDEPYNPESEKFATRVLLNLDSVCHIIEKLTQQLKSDSKNPNILSDFLHWMNEGSIQILFDLIDAFYKIKYHYAVIQLSTLFLKILDFINKNNPDPSNTNHRNYIHLLKENLINSLLSAGQFNATLYYLSVFESNFLMLFKKNSYYYELYMATDHNYRSTLAQQHDDLASSKIHLDTAWDYLLRVIDKAPRIQGIDLETLSDAATKILGSLVDSYKLLATELFEERKFLEARAIFIKVGKEQVEDIVLKILNIPLISQGKQHTKKVKKPPKNKPLESDTEINQRWCGLAHFVTLREWLSKNLPKGCSVQAEKGCLVLSLNSNELAGRLCTHFSKSKIKHRMEVRKVVLENTHEVETRTLSEALGLPANSSDRVESKFRLEPSAKLERESSETLQFRILRRMKFKSAMYPNLEYFALVSTHLEAFYQRCQDPLTKMRALRLCISVNLGASFLAWRTNNGNNHTELLNSAKKYLEDGKKYAKDAIDKKTGDQEKAKGKKSKKMKKPSAIQEEVENIFTEAQSRIEEYEILLREYMRVIVSKTVEHDIVFFERRQKELPDYVSALRLGLAGITDRYNTTAKHRDTLKEELETKSLCFEEIIFQIGRKQLFSSTLFCFELAFELLTQSTLLREEGNNEALALERIRKEFILLSKLKEQTNIECPAHIEAMILVVRTKLDSTKPVESLLSQLNQAYKKIKEKTQPIFYIATIHLAKIDSIISHQHPDPYKAIYPFLQDLFDLIKALQPNKNERNKFNFEYICYELFYFMERYLVIPQEQLHRFDIESTTKFLSLQISVVEYLLSVINDEKKLSLILRNVKVLCDKLHPLLRETFAILMAIPQEKMVRTDLAASNSDPKAIPFLIPKVLLSQIDLYNLCYDKTDPFLPHHPLIPLVLSCAEMYQYETDRERLGACYNQELSQIYSTTANSAKSWFRARLPETLITALATKPESEDWFEPLVHMMRSLTTAHTSSKEKIAPELCPLIQRVLSVYPENQYLLFTLFCALTDNTPKTTPCPEAVERCFKAAKAGHPFAQYRYARLLEEGHYGATLDEDTAKQFLQRSSEQEYYKAQIRLAKLPQNGLFASEINTHSTEVEAVNASNNPIAQDNTVEKPVDLEAGTISDPEHNSDDDLFIPTQYDSDNEEIILDQQDNHKKYNT